MIPYAFKPLKVAPSDILDAARTIQRVGFNLWDLTPKHWVPATTYLDWARSGLKTGGEQGFTTAVMHAKRAVCRMIDGLVLRNHLTAFQNKNYPKKMDGLFKIGIGVPDVVHKLVIDARNELEHKYTLAGKTDAKDAVDLADLVLRATKEETDASSIITVGGSISYSSECHEEDGANVETVAFRSLSERPMLFVDVFEEPVCVKIVHPQDGEICFAELTQFNDNESIEFARILRGDGMPGSYNIGTEHFYRELKRQAGI